MPRFPQPIGNILAQLMAQRGLGRVRSAEEFESAWREAVGEPLVDYTRAGALRGGKLEVMVSHSALLQELTFRKRELIDKLKSRLPDQTINDISFRVGPLM